ncbi:MAG: SCO family protein [Burkholderiaceae bacterium]
MVHRRWICALALAGLLAGLQGCGSARPQFQNVDITGANFAHDFALTDQNGVPRKLADFRGKAVVMFFGYTQCPDVCPTTLSDLASAMHTLGPLSDRVQVLFVTVDPERDTPKVLAAYVPNFDKRFLALYGDAAQTETTAREFKVYYAKVPGPTPTSYTMDHSAGSYVFDPEGHVRLFIRNEATAASIAHDLKILVS